MQDKRICISKQTTFISLIVFLLLGYVLFAYRTMWNKTSTNSRASEVKDVKTVRIITPRDCDYEACFHLTNPVINNDKKVQFVGDQIPASTIHGDTEYAVFYKKYGEPLSTSRALFTVKGSKIIQTLRDFSPNPVVFSPKNVAEYAFTAFAIK